MALAIRRFAPAGNGKPVFHFAPEEAIADILIEKFGNDYRPADYVPEEYSWSKVPVTKVDLSRPLDYLPRGGVNGLIHSHVLEHVPGSIERVICEMNESLAPGGFHFFQVPIERGWYREDMNPLMSPERREEIFLQFDHLRVFGTEDFEDRCLRLFKGFNRVDLAEKISDGELANAAVPPSSLLRYNGHTAFLFVKET